MRILYSLIHYLIIPLVVLRLAWRGFKSRGYWERTGERFGFSDPLSPQTPRLWIHAVSIGEVQASLPLVRALLGRHPGLSIVVTTTTPTGAQRVTQALGESVVHRYFPFDLSGSVQRFLDNVRPTAAVLMETELWPNVLHFCARRSIPVLLANARLSARSAAGYRKIVPFGWDMLTGVAGIAAQTREDAERFISLGAAPEQVRITGSLKFDIRLPAHILDQARALRRSWGRERPIWIAASTHDGENEPVLDAFQQVREAIPHCLLVLVPRHPEVFSKAVALCQRRGYRTLQRSESSPEHGNIDVFIGDTIGELLLFYAASDLAFVGGSLVDTGGHNLLEPASLGVPVIFGPHIYNFADIGRTLLEVGAAHQVMEAEVLGATVVRHLEDPELRESMGDKGKQYVKRNRGALESVLDLVEGFITQREARAPTAEEVSRP